MENKENRAMMQKTLEFYSGQMSPRGLARFYDTLQSEVVDPRDLVEAFLDIKGWRRLDRGIQGAATCAETLLKQLLSNEDKGANELDFSPLLSDRTDILLVKAAVLMGKIIYCKGTGDNICIVLNDRNRAADAIDKSKADIEIKLAAMDLFRQL